jgi:hypothetical protein
MSNISDRMKMKYAAIAVIGSLLILFTVRTVFSGGRCDQIRRITEYIEMTGELDMTDAERTQADWEQEQRAQDRYLRETYTDRQTDPWHAFCDAMDRDMKSRSA